MNNEWFEVRAVSKRGARQGQWVALKRFFYEDEAWNYAQNNRNLCGLLELWRITGVDMRKNSGDASFVSEKLHSLHYGVYAKTKPVTIVG
jgi:hypothetical protein